ncbi:hypothetical protein D6D25_07604, partial [Aureobasidium pullulans]
SAIAKKEALKRAHESDSDDVEEVVAPSRSSIKANTDTSASPAAKKQLIEPPLSSRDIVENYNDESDEDDSQPKTSESLITKKSTVEIDSEDDSDNDDRKLQLKPKATSSDVKKLAAKKTSANLSKASDEDDSEDDASVHGSKATKPKSKAPTSSAKKLPVNKATVKPSKSDTEDESADESANQVRKGTKAKPTVKKVPAKPTNSRETDSESEDDSEEDDDDDLTSKVTKAKPETFTSSTTKKQSGKAPVPVPEDDEEEEDDDDDEDDEEEPAIVFSEYKGDLFAAPPKSLLLHACNCEGSWNKGIAYEFQKNYPDHYAKYSNHCRDNGIEAIIGTCLIIPPQSVGGDHWVGCLFTSRKYGRGKDKKDKILEQTERAVEHLVEQIENMDERPKLIWMPKINSGLFRKSPARTVFTSWSEYDDPDSKLLEEAQIWVEDGEVWYIHPVLQRDHWNHMSNDDWNSIRPSIELASRILDMVEILPFFYGLIAGSVYDLKDSAHNQAHNIIFQEWEMKEVPTVLRAVGQEAESVFLYMVGLRGSVEWEFSHIALSDRRFAQTGWLSKSKKALVEINEDFLDILSGRQQVHDYSMSWEPGTNVESARLRTQVALAITIVHEFAHAIWFCINKKYKVDPYLRGHFINELGFELEHMLFSGLIMPIGTPAVEAAPYGFKIDRFPEAGIRDDEET